MATARDSLSFLPSNKFAHTVLFSSIVLISACGGGGGGGSSNSGSTVTPPGPSGSDYSNYMYRTVEPGYDGHGGGWHMLDLGGQNANGDASIISARSTNQHCSDGTVNGMTIEFQMGGDGACGFDIVVDKNGEEETSRLIVTQTTTPDTIPALSQIMYPNENRVIDLANHSSTAAFIANGYVLTEQIEIFGDINATVDTNNNSLDIVTNDLLGPNRVFFFLEKSVDNILDTKIGVLDVTVTSATNTGPVIHYPNFSHTIHSRTMENFDLVKLGIVSDPDPDDELQIIRLDSPLGGYVGLGTSDDPLTDYQPQNTAFHFRSDVIGSYPVAYTVTDHKGGYASGTVIVNVGFLTSPNTPLAATPGRMIESVYVSDDTGSLYMRRPYLLAEVEQTHHGVTGETLQNGETWAYLTRDEAAAFCQSQGINWRLPTRTAMTALIDTYKNDPDHMTGQIGWPTGLYNDTKETLFYAIQQTDNASTVANTTINAVDGTLSDTEQQGIVLCVISPQEQVVLETNQVVLTPADNTKTIPLINWNHGVAPRCDLVRTDRESQPDGGATSTQMPVASCTTTPTAVHITGGDSGRAVFSIHHPEGETITGTINPAILTVINDYQGTGLPSIPNYQIQGWIDGAWKTVANQDGVDQALVKRVRVGTYLRAEYEYYDPDMDWQHDESEVSWLGSARPVADQEGIYQATSYGSIMVTFTPKNAQETGPSVSRTITLTNTPPTIRVPLTYQSGMPTEIRFGTAFNSTTDINAVPEYSDAENDPENIGMRRYEWESKNPWSSTWAPMPVYSNELPTAMRDGFFNPQHDFYSQDLRVTVTVAEQNGQRVSLTKSIIPVGHVDRPDITLDASTTIRHLGALFDYASTAAEFDALCRTKISNLQPGQTTRVLRTSTINEKIQGRLPAPKYYSDDYVSYNWTPVVNGNDQVETWDSTNGIMLPGAPHNGLICEVLTK